MPYAISTSPYSFLQFAETDTIQDCMWADADMCLPVYDEDDAWFQFVIQADTEEEADDLCDIQNVLISLGLVENCADGFLLEFTQKPSRYRVSPLRVLYVWQHGLPGFKNVIDVGKCFHIKIELADQSFCSNCFQRIGDDCLTSVVQYSNDDNFAGMLYCAGEVIEEQDCDPLIIQFTDQATMQINWTAYLSSRYGNSPSVQCWIYIDGELQLVAIQITMDTYPPTLISLDFGGVSSGVIKIM